MPLTLPNIQSKAMSQFTNPKCLTLTPVSEMKISPSFPSIPKSQIPNPNPNPNFQNQDLSLPPIPKSQLGRRSRTDIGKSIIVFGGYNALEGEREPTLMVGGAKFKWYSIPVPYYAASDDDAEAEAEAEKKLSPFSVVELHKLFSFVALKSSIYCLSSPTTKTWIFNGCYWKLGPQMNVRRSYHHTIVLGGKPYVLGGLYADAREEYIWMEVLNLKHTAWRPLPNPPLRISSFGMVSAALQRTKQIIVTAFLRATPRSTIVMIMIVVVWFTYMMYVLVVGQNLTLRPSIYVVGLQLRVVIEL